MNILRRLTDKKSAADNNAAWFTARNYRLMN
jgi:hypothetical protein